MTRGFILRERERERESVSACVLACSLQYKGLNAVLYKWPYLGKRDGPDQSVHLRNVIRLFFFRISSEMGVHT